MAPESPRKAQSGSRVFETQVDEGKPTGFRRYINVVAITVPVLIGVILVVVIARSLSGPDRTAPATSSNATPTAEAAPGTKAGAGSGAGASAPTPMPAAAATPTPSGGPTPSASPTAAPTAKILPTVAAGQAAAPTGATKPVTAPATGGPGDPTLTLAPEVTAPMKISGDEVQVPMIAKIAHAHGITVLDATISKTGTVEDLKFVSGPPLLENAALTAVRTYRYQPILSNGKPVRVRTQVILIFNLTPAASQSK